MRKILIIENHHKLDREEQHAVFNYLDSLPDKNYDIIDFSCFRSKTDQEVWDAVNECTDILCQTAVSNGSEYQFKNMLRLLSKVKVSKDIYICLLAEDLHKYIDENYEDDELLAIQHHNIYEVDYEGPVKQIDFNDRINKYLQRLADEKKYRDEARLRPTGRAIKILACNAGGSEFKAMVIGDTVPELDMSGQDNQPDRGVWVWGDTEPVKLVNDCGLKEYELVGNLTFEDLCEEISKSTAFDISQLSGLERIGLKQIVNDLDSSPHDVANFICAEANIEKRKNRAVITEIISRYRYNKID